VFGVVALALPVVAGVGVWRHGLQLAWQDRDAAYAGLQQVKQNPDSSPGFFEMIRHQMRRRPAEPYFPLVAAQAMQLLEKDAMPWIARALERDPTRGETHLVLALELARHGARLQALEELRRGLEWDAGGMTRAVRLARAISSKPEEIARAAPSGALGTSLLLSAAAARGDYELRRGLIEIASERAPLDQVALAAHGQIVLEALEDGHSQCDGERAASCMDTVRSIVSRLRKVDVRSTDALELEASLVGHDGHLPEAVSTLQRGCAAVAEPARCLRTALTLATRAGDKSLVEGVASDYLRAACSSPRECARGETRAGRAFMTVRAPLVAYEHFKRAAEIEPSQSSWAQAANAARAAGVEVLAKTAERKANRLAGANSLAP
jgi:hypothetical protein